MDGKIAQQLDTRIGMGQVEWCKGYEFDAPWDLGMRYKIVL